MPTVAVIGAGPAGCAAAGVLGRLGFNVAVFERGAAGKEKACGDGLAPYAVERLARYGIDERRMLQLGGRSFPQVDVYSSSVLLWSIPLGTSPGWVLARAALDQTLRTYVASYAHIHYQAHVTGFARTRGGTLQLSLGSSRSSSAFECDAIILACGAAGSLQRKWSIDGEPIRGASLSGYVETNAVTAPVFQFCDTYRPGYAWIFPMVDGRANAGVCALTSDNTKHLSKLASQFLINWGISSTPEWRGGAGPCWSGMGRRWHSEAGVISCGDAAGLADPYSGEGITAALVSGEQAGVAIAEYLSSGSRVSALEDYSKWVAEYFADRYRHTAALKVWSALCGLPFL